MKRKRSDEDVAPPDFVVQRIPKSWGMQYYKYYMQRYRLWSQFDHGVWMDEVTPEKLALYIAEKCGNKGVLLDGFCGTGGNAIQFALAGNFVIAIDIDPQKISCARHNAKIYGVEDQIEFIVGDFLNVAPTFRVDVIVLAPPWGGPSYTSEKYFDLEADIPMDGKYIYDLAKTISNNIIYILPKNVYPEQIWDIMAEGDKCEFEWNYYNDKVKCITCYFGFDL